MTYEEKREFRLQISQMLADAGLNQKTIKDMVNTEIRNKVERAVNQRLEYLNSQVYSGDFIEESIRGIVKDTYYKRDVLERIAKEVLQNRVLKVVLGSVEVSE